MLHVAYSLFTVTLRAVKVPDPLRFVPDEGGGEGVTQHDPRGSVAVKVAHKPKPVDHHARPEPETWNDK